MKPVVIMEKIAGLLEDKKAKSIAVIGIGSLCVLADYFIICSGTSVRHVKSLADEVIEKMNEHNLPHLHLEGYETADWVLIDYGDVVIHIFREEAREFYNIERLWSDGEMIERNVKK